MEKKIYAVDLDLTLCTGKFREEEPTPIQYRIDKINSLYTQWNVILICTARNPKYYQQTLAWLIKHWVMFHWLNMQYKPWVDIFIDDKAINDKDFFNS
jgi:hypothetical protein